MDTAITIYFGIALAVFLAGWVVERPDFPFTLRNALVTLMAAVTWPGLLVIVIIVISRRKRQGT